MKLRELLVYFLVEKTARVGQIVCTPWRNFWKFAPTVLYAEKIFKLLGTQHVNVDSPARDDGATNKQPLQSATCPVSQIPMNLIYCILD